MRSDSSRTVPSCPERQKHVGPIWSFATGVIYLGQLVEVGEDAHFGITTVALTVLLHSTDVKSLMSLNCKVGLLCGSLTPSFLFTDISEFPQEVVRMHHQPWETTNTSRA